MGTFMGHFLPGSFFMLFAMWWTIGALHRYYRGRFRKGPPFQASLTYPGICCGGCFSRLQLEGFFKVFFTSVGLIGEIVTGIRDGQFVIIGNGQHATMFAFFGISGIIDFLMHYGVPLPKLTDYVFCTLCFSVEGLLFMFHLHGRSSLDQSLHKLLVYTIWCCVLAMIFEMRYPKSIFCTLARCFFVFLQGTWFTQVGAILYPPFKGMKQWNGESHDDIMISTILFAWHIFFIFLFMFVTAFILARVHGKDIRLDMTEGNNKGLTGSLYNRPGDQICLMETDEEEDIELGITRCPEETKLVNGP